MQNKRQVNFSVFFSILKGNGAFAIIGAIFIFVSLFILIPLITLLSVKLLEPYDKYDVAAIKMNGVNKTAKVVDIATLYNTTINGRHPKVINYIYDNNGQSTSDKFETVELDKIDHLNVGDTIAIKAYNNQSIIANLETFSFPFYIFYLLPGVFLLLGVTFLLVGLIPALKKLALYKNGIVKDAHVISMNVKTNARTRNFRQFVIVNYYYTGNNGERLIGKSTTNDFNLLNEMKTEDKIKIFVSEEDENKSCLVPKLEAMKYNWDV